MPLLRLILCAAVAASLGFAPAPFPKPQKKVAGIDELQGTWNLVSYLLSGTDWTSRASTPIWQVERNQLHVYSRADFASRGARTTYELRLDPTVTPPLFEMRSGSEVCYHGSYRLDGKRWVIVFAAASPRPNRPVRFSADEGYLLTFERLP
jgi:uncharacterized protein (TIGR03067 family)